MLGVVNNHFSLEAGEQTISLPLNCTCGTCSETRVALQYQNYSLKIAAGPEIDWYWSKICEQYLICGIFLKKNAAVKIPLCISGVFNISFLPYGPP